MKQRAFTLAEVMIVLTVIGVLTAILLPSAIHSTPDENVLKFKKANATLFRVINELVNSNEYYLEGDLGKKPDGTAVDDSSYLCETMADLLSVKEKNCNVEGVTTDPNIGAPWYTPDVTTLDVFIGYCDENCKWSQDRGGIKAYFKTSDNITYYESNADLAFGNHVTEGNIYGYYKQRMTDGIPTYMVYKCLCVDLEGIESGKGEDPFGYALRVDGKMLSGKRANDWIKKSIQNED